MEWLGGVGRVGNSDVVTPDEVEKSLVEVILQVVAYAPGSKVVAQPTWLHSAHATCLGLAGLGCWRGKRSVEV